VNIPKLPHCIPKARGKVSKQIGIAILKLLGWHIAGQLPQQPKFVVAVAPHTSNWDFVVGVSAMLAMNLRIKFMGKKAIFIWPFKIVLAHWGGIPIDRHSKHGVVEQMVGEFEQSKQLILAIAPEGTRKKTKQWKSGFLQIAHQANVPVVPVSLDFQKKQMFFHKEVYISSDINLELEKFKSLFVDVCAKKPQLV